MLSIINRTSLVLALLFSVGLSSSVYANNECWSNDPITPAPGSNPIDYISQQCSGEIAPAAHLADYLFQQPNCTVPVTGSPDWKTGQKYYLKNFNGNCTEPPSPKPAADPNKNVFISFTGKNNITQFGEVVKEHNLAGAMIWEISGDEPYTNNQSLLKTLNDYTYQGSQPSKYSGKIPTLGIYWADWDMYLDQHQISQPNAPLKNFSVAINKVSQNHTINVYYAFLEAVADKFVDGNTRKVTCNVADKSKCVGATSDNSDVMSSKLGTLYFNDPWSDLSETNCTFSNLTDSYVMQEKNVAGASPKQSCATGTKYNNFGELVNTIDPNNSNIKKYISIGGYSHNDTFEVLFNPDGSLYQDREQNFLNSAAQILEENHLAGIDLDYESTSMTHQQSEQYLQLIKDLRAKLGTKYNIIMTVLSDPAYLEGTRAGPNGTQVGFDNLKEFNGYIDNLQLMTYDFHGAFDFTNGGTNKTGFLANVRPYENDKFSVYQSVMAATNYIDSDKIIIGVPAYGRAISGVTQGTTNGLSQGLIDPSQAVETPGGDMDNPCGPNQDGTCSGMFTYHYIIDGLFPEDFIPSPDVSDQYGASYAYARNWSAPPPSK